MGNIEKYSYKQDADGRLRRRLQVPPPGGLDQTTLSDVQLVS